MFEDFLYKEDKVLNCCLINNFFELCIEILVGNIGV